MNRAQVKDRFQQDGIVVRQWAKEKGFTERVVYEVLNGVKKGRRGEPYRVALELGLVNESAEMRGDS